MAKPKDYWTSQRPDGTWAVKTPGAARASAVAPTQAEAWDRAKHLARANGGEAYLRGKNGQIRERNTYGHDPEKSPG
jgi:Uncharacterized protein conserved in bacteria (DUF2188)